MRTRNGPLWVALLLVGVATGGAQAQSPEWEPAWWMGEPLRQFVATLPTNEGDEHAWLSQVLTGGQGLQTETCAFVASMGSKPRLDGGGEGLARFDPLWDPAAIDWDHLGGTWPQTDVVIIDMFNFEDLITKLGALTGQSFTANEAEQ